MNLLVNPPEMRHGLTVAPPPPLGLLHLAAMDPDTKILDLALEPEGAYDRLEQVLAESSPRTVGVPIYTIRRHSSLRCLRIAHEAGSRTVAGGPHTSIMHEQLAEHYGFIDHLVIGDGEEAWRALCQGDILPRTIRRPIADLDDLPLPAWERVRLSDYPARGWGSHRGNDLTRLPRLSVILGRGCTGHCTFCSTWWIQGTYRHHGRDWIARHLRKLWGLGGRHLVFQDDNLTADREAALALCDCLDEYTFSWSGTTRADKVDRALLARMRDAGCYRLAFGIEHGSQKILDKMHKDTDLDAALEARQLCKEVGIAFVALMIEGFPYNDAQTRAEDRAFRAQLHPDEWGSLGHTAVLPGTALYAACKRAGLIDDDFWLGPKPYYTYHGGLE